MSPTVNHILVFDGSVMDSIPKWEIIGQATSDASGIATFYITHDGTSTGNVLLSSIDHVSITTYSTSATVITRPKLSGREKNLGSKYVSANVTNVSGTTILGITVLSAEAALASVVVDFRVVGSPA